MEASHDRARRPRFARSRPAPLHFTPDDLTILRHVAEHRFLRSTHLVQLIERSPDRLIRRLAHLFHNGFLDRPIAQRDSFARVGSAPLVYALGTKGAAVLAEIDARYSAAVEWTDKNRSAKRPYLEHALLVADLMVGLERAVRDHPAIALLSARDLQPRAPLAPQRAAPWTMTATAGGTGIAVVPDKVFALHFADRGRTNYFLVEADRATMPIERASLAQSSIKKKLLAYHHGHASKRHTNLWGIPGFRVLTITTSRDRIASMIEVVKEITNGKGSNVFLFTDVETLAAHDPLTLPWISGKNTIVRLIE